MSLWGPVWGWQPTSMCVFGAIKPQSFPEGTWIETSHHEAREVGRRLSHRKYYYRKWPLRLPPWNNWEIGTEVGSVCHASTTSMRGSGRRMLGALLSSRDTEPIALSLRKEDRERRQLTCLSTVQTDGRLPQNSSVHILPNTSKPLTEQGQALETRLSN